MAARSRAIAGAPFALAAIVAAVVLLHDGRAITFSGDEWAYVGGFVNRPGSASVLHSPGSGYLLIVPLLAYRGLLDLFGAASYLPYRIAGVAAHVACAGLLYALVRRRAGTLAALCVSLPLLFLAAGPPPPHAEDAVTMTARRLPMLLAIAFGLGALLALDRLTRAGGWAACGLLALSVLSHPVGTAFVAVAAVRVWSQARRPAAGWLVFAVPAAAWLAGTWTLGNGSSGLDGARILAAPVYTARSLADAVAGTLGMLNAPVPLGGDGIGRALPAAGLAVLVLLALRSAKSQGRTAGRLLAALAGLGALLAATALQPGSGSLGAPDSARYVYPEVVLGLLVVAEAVPLLPSPRRAVRAAAVLLPLIVALDLVQLGELGGSLGQRSTVMRAELAALDRAQAIELARGLDPAPALHEQLPRAGLHARRAFGGITLATYDRIATAYGTPAMSAGELRTASPEVRVEAGRDEQIVAGATTRAGRTGAAGARSRRSA